MLSQLLVVLRRISKNYSELQSIVAIAKVGDSKLTQDEIRRLAKLAEMLESDIKQYTALTQAMLIKMAEESVEIRQMINNS